MLPERATCWRQRVAWQQFARSGNMLPVSQQHNYYSFMSQSTCIPLYPATHGQQTGNNFVANIQATCWQQQDTCWRATCCPGVNMALGYTPTIWLNSKIIMNINSYCALMIFALVKSLRWMCALHLSCFYCSSLNVDRNF